MKRNGLYKKYTKDGIHPTYDGDKIMDPLVSKAIEKVMETK